MPGQDILVCQSMRLATLSTLHSDTVAPPFNADRVGEPCWQQAHVDWHVPVFFILLRRILQNNVICSEKITD